MVPRCEIVTIGSELLFGQIVDTNAAWLAETLNRSGVSVRYHSTVGDVLEDIIQVLRLALSRADVVVCSGGIGPTRDDLTREAAASAAGVPLRFHPELMEEIESFFHRMGYRMPENNRRQAYIPEGGSPISNPIGTAPAFWMLYDGRMLVALPGVPRELKLLTETKVVPLIRKRLGLEGKTIRYRVLKLTGLGESAVDRQIGDLMHEGANPSVGLLAAPGNIRIRISAEADSEEAAQALILPVEREIRNRLGKLIYGSGDDTLEGVVDALLVERNRTLSVLDTVSGGVGAGLMRVPSKQLRQAWDVPSPEAMREFLGNAAWSPPRGREESESQALELARRVTEKGRSSTGLVLMGFPKDCGDGLRIELTLSVWDAETSRTTGYAFEGDRETLYDRCTVLALDMLRKTLLEL